MFNSSTSSVMRGMCLKRQNTATQMAGFKVCYMHAAICTTIKIINGASDPLTSRYLPHHLISSSQLLQAASPATHWLAHWGKASKGASPGFMNKAEPEGRFPHSFCFMPGQKNKLPVPLTYSRSCTHTNIIIS